MVCLGILILKSTENFQVILSEIIELWKRFFESALYFRWREKRRSLVPGLAEENLKLGTSVIADSVNGLQETRNAWKKVARNASVPFFEIELICSDLDEHQRRVEERKADIINHQLPNWKSVKEREYLHWAADLILDTSKYSAEHAVEIILSHISKHMER